MANEAHCKYCGMTLEEPDQFCPECGSLIEPDFYYIGDRWFKLPLVS